jgi:hypothetical protein
MPAAADYPVTLRMDPFPLPLGTDAARLPVVAIVLNDTTIATLQMLWTPGRVGSYDLVLPRAAVRQGANRLVVKILPQPGTVGMTQPGLAEGNAVAVWYLRVHPATAAVNAR